MVRPTFFGVIGNRDYIKYKGQPTPFWHFLDKHPEGWLSSLAYPRIDLPETGKQIGDCGAWSYRNLDIPKLGKTLVTAQSTLEQYKQYFRPGAMVIAPDHMLIPGLGNIDDRRAFNVQAAREFIACTADDDSHFIPMATAHGTTVDERMEAADALLSMGYTHIALGGLAGQAGRRSTVFDIVVRLREAYPDVYMHVLGLSAPVFARVWAHIGVDSYDGAAHFKKAFTAGRFFVSKGMELGTFVAAREGEKITAPYCNCRACRLLRIEGHDTRRYGSNQTNMGRAAHNLNHLMKALDVAIRNPAEPFSKDAICA